MAKSSGHVPLGIIRSTAMISLGLVSLAGSIAVTLCRRIVAVPARSSTVDSTISQLVLDDWEAELSRLNLPSKREVEALRLHLAELEAQIDQLIQQRSQPKAED